MYPAVSPPISKIGFLRINDKYAKIGFLLSTGLSSSVLLSIFFLKKQEFSAADDVELTDFNWPRDKVLKWFMEPLLIMKEQIRGLQLTEEEEASLKKLIMAYSSKKPDDWNNKFPSTDSVRRAQLQAILRRQIGSVLNFLKKKKTLLTIESFLQITRDCSVIISTAHIQKKVPESGEGFILGRERSRSAEPGEPGVII